MSKTKRKLTFTARVQKNSHYKEVSTGNGRLRLKRVEVSTQWQVGIKQRHTFGVPIPVELVIFTLAGRRKVVAAHRSSSSFHRECVLKVKLSHDSNKAVVDVIPYLVPARL